MKEIKICYILALIFLFIPVFSPAWGGHAEPGKPSTDKVFDPETEKKIKELPGRPVKDVFDELKKVEYLVDEDLSHKAVKESFKNRKSEALNHALGILNYAPYTESEGKVKRWNDDYYVARKTFEVFPEDAFIKIKETYPKGDSITKGNIIQAVGKLAGGTEVKDFLLAALEDQTLYEALRPDAEGEPMRLCDMAYNQLVLRYKMTGVLRTIGTSHRIEVRDYHIAVLKGLMMSD